MNTDIAAQHAIDHWKRDGFSALSDSEKVLATVWMFAAGVGNSGFAGYFSGRNGDLAFHAPTALRTIGARQLAEIAEEANGLFGPDGPPAERTAREKALESLAPEVRNRLDAFDKRYTACEEDVDELLEQYLAHTSTTPQVH